MTPDAAKPVVAANDKGSYGQKAVNGVLKEEKAEGTVSSRLSQDHDIVLKTFRLLIADLCEQFGGGHPGGAIGMAAIGVSLWKYVMRYAPHTPDFFNRDRFVLSNGHTCLFQYTFLHLTGYKAMTLDKLKGYHSSEVDTLCPGHPEIEHDGIEVTTGPLGQGIANAVGMAMATKHLAAEFNQPGYDVVSNHTWCMVGDACLQEGVGLEAISLAGHLRLNNLTVIYDNNQITCDGSVDMTNTEDVNAKMRACGWEVLTIDDGSFDIDTIVAALEFAKKSTGRPVFINVKTVIGLGSAVAGDAVAHGAAFDPEDVANMHKAYGFPEEHYTVPDKVKEFFADLPSKGEEHVKEWNTLLESYTKAHPELAKDFKARLSGDLPTNWKSLIPDTFTDKPTASRASSGLVFNPIAEKTKNFIVGTADLTPSVNMSWSDKESFQNPDLKTECGINGSYKGRYVHWGVREHAMCAVSNGLAAFHHHAPLHGSTGQWGDEGHQAIIPVTSSFFMFYIYAAPAVRMGAIQSLQVIHAATHDSIGMGEDGPTHQPIELAALYRAMPNLLYIRPGDSEETAGAWIAAIEAKKTPSIISTSRHKLPQLAPKTKREGVAKGAYVLEEAEDADVTLIGIGAELNIAVEAAETMRKEKNLKVRVVSFPCQRLFDKQPKSYQRDVLRRHKGIPAVVVEAYASHGWARYADAAVCMSTDRYGQSLPGSINYDYFGFTPKSIMGKIEKYTADLKSGEVLKGEFVELSTKREHGKWERDESLPFYQ